MEGLVDHGALLRREESGTTTTESEDEFDTGEHLCLSGELSIPHL